VQFKSVSILTLMALLTYTNMLACGDSDSECRHLAFCGTEGLICGKWAALTAGRSSVVETAQAVESQRGRRFLVVGDNGDAAALLAVLLQLEGHEVQIAANGHEALARAEQFHPEVVLMDLQTSGGDALEASRRIRERPWGNSVLIAALTGMAHETDRRREREAGIDLHFIKPVDTALLLAIVTRSLNSSRALTSTPNTAVRPAATGDDARARCEAGALSN
jgi:CheY-like chemotaxis protein